MKHERKQSLLANVRMLRKNLTKEEKRLWYDFLSKYPVRFRRQEIIGSYIVDFYCQQVKLVIELDGSQHYEQEGKTSDAIRTKVLAGQGIEVLRFANTDVNKNFEGVCRVIDREVCNRTGHPSVAFGDSSPQGEPDGG